MTLASLRRSALLALSLILAPMCVHAADAPGESIHLEVPVLPAMQAYADLLQYPGYLAVALENNGLSPSLSSKLKLNENGRGAEIRNAVIRFVERKGDLYFYDAGLVLGLADSKLTFPVVVDLASVASGKIAVTLTPPLAKLMPTEVIDRIQIKTQLMANAAAQQKVLDYLQNLSKEIAPRGGVDAGVEPLVVAILADAYNRGGGPSAPGDRESGDAVPLSDQWLLILTLVIWLLVVPAVLVAHKIRRHRRTKTA